MTAKAYGNKQKGTRCPSLARIPHNILMGTADAGFNLRDSYSGVLQHCSGQPEQRNPLITGLLPFPQKCSSG